MAEPSLSNRDATAQEWSDSDFVLPVGMVGYENPTGRYKRGDGESVWDDLPWSDEATNENSSSFGISEARVREIVNENPAATPLTVEQVQDSISQLIEAGTLEGIEVVYDDAGNAMSFSVPAPESVSGWNSLIGGAIHDHDQLPRRNSGAVGL